MDSIEKQTAFFKASGRGQRYEKCCVPSCETSKKRHVICKLFKFPKSEPLRMKWISSIGLSDGASNKKYLLCEKHFEGKFLGKRKLKANAIPTLHLNTNLNYTEDRFVSSKMKKIKKCCIATCDITNTSHSMFRFPNKGNQVQKWIEACNIDCSVNIKNKFVCSSHFEKRFLGKKKLLANAVPSLNLQIKDIYNFVEESVHIVHEENKNENLCKNKGDNFQYSNSIQSQTEIVIKDKVDSERQNELIEPWCKKCHKSTKNVAYYSSKLKKSNDKLLALEKENKLLIKKLKKYKRRKYHKNVIEHIDSLVHVNQNSKEFCKMLLAERSKSTEWSENQKQIAQTLNYKSNSTYLFMRENLEFSLPSKSSIQRWSPLKKLHPGYNKALLENLKNVINKMDSFDKEAVIIFDEVAIRKDLVYDPYIDQVEGLVDFGNGERDQLIGKHICVFMLRGLLSNWKYVLNYFVSSDSNISGQKLNEILLKNIEIAFSLDLNIRAVIGDQGPNNRKAFRLLGVSKEKPYFTYDNKKIYAVFDIPHIIKSIRNTLMRSDIDSI